VYILKGPSYQEVQ
jgi:hypothetical protein